eukprot:CAMPEP_0179325464 /NCGR_PEP_ID=MMETSP0797-20121207/60902_1 /TAXON_ID=47934 /ORGANISM="Dinophysis acuminata, Strain DAEP01" /LENGTH=53 /DNA_ID=CAMNT_0021037643 /DNA_START=42 /DNA_END=203 /DNA_ORIENTATION=+
MNGLATGVCAEDFTQKAWSSGSHSCADSGFGSVQSLSKYVGSHAVLRALVQVV